jgi:hypothetical protein
MASPDHKVIIDSHNSFLIREFMDYVGFDNKRLYIYISKVIDIIQDNSQITLQEAIQRTKQLYAL